MLPHLHKTYLCQEAGGMFITKGNRMWCVLGTGISSSVSPTSYTMCDMYYHGTAVQAAQECNRTVHL